MPPVSVFVTDRSLHCLTVSQRKFSTFVGCELLLLIHDLSLPQIEPAPLSNPRRCCHIKSLSHTVSPKQPVIAYTFPHLRPKIRNVDLLSSELTPDIHHHGVPHKVPKHSQLSRRRYNHQLLHQHLHPPTQPSLPLSAPRHRHSHRPLPSHHPVPHQNHHRPPLQNRTHKRRQSPL